MSENGSNGWSAAAVVLMIVAAVLALYAACAVVVGMWGDYRCGYYGYPYHELTPGLEIMCLSGFGRDVKQVPLRSLR